MRPTSSDTSRTLCINRTLVYAIGILALAAVVAFAIVYRESGFQFVFDKEGKLTFQFEGNNKARTAELLDKALTEAGSPEKGDVEIVLQRHGYFHASDPRMVDALRDLGEAEESQRFASALRGLLYDLKGPFSRPYTFSGARDARLLQAFDDLDPEGKDPEAVSPLLSSLWRMSLDLQGIFQPRRVNAIVEAAPGVRTNSASTCMGSILDGKEVMVTVNGQMRQLAVRAAEFCLPRSPRQLLAGEPERLRLAPEDVAVLQGSGDSNDPRSELWVNLHIFPKHFRNRDEVSISKEASLH